MYTRKDTKTDRQTGMHRQTGLFRQTDRQTERQTDWQTDMYRQTDRQTERKAYTDRQACTDRQTDRQTCTDRQTERQAYRDWQTCTDRQTGIYRRKDRQTDRQTSLGPTSSMLQLLLRQRIPGMLENTRGFPVQFFRFKILETCSSFIVLVSGRYRTSYRFSHIPCEPNCEEKYTYFFNFYFLVCLKYIKKNSNLLSLKLTLLICSKLHWNEKQEQQQNLWNCL